MSGVGIGIVSTDDATSARDVVGKEPFELGVSLLSPKQAPHSSLYPEIGRAEAADFAGLLFEFSEADDRIAVDLVLARWAERDPNGAVAFLIENEGSDSKPLNEFFGIWAELDLDRALAKIASLVETNPHRSDIINRYSYQWRNAAFAAVARIDPERALDRGLPKMSTQTPQWVYVAIRRLARSDPQGAAKFLPRLQGWGEVLHPAGDIARIWVAKDPEQAFEWARGLDDEGLGSYVRRVIIESLHESPELAGDWFASLTTSEQDSQTVGALETLASRFARRDPIAAYDWVMKVIPAEHRQDALEGAITPNIPADQLDAFLDRFASDEVYEALASELAEDRTVSELTVIVESLAKRAERAESGEDLQMVLFSAVAKWSFQEPQSLADWAQDWQGSDSIRDMALSKSLSANRESIDVDGALALFEGIQEETARSSAANDLCAVWALSDPVGGLDWAQSQEMITQTNAIQAIVRTWVREEPQIASQHLNSMPAGDARDTAVATLINASYRRDPAVSFEWAKSLSDPLTLQGSMAKILPIWAERDLEASTNAITQAGFDQQTADQLLAIAREANSRSQ